MTKRKTRQQIRNAKKREEIAIIVFGCIVAIPCLALLAIAMHHTASLIGA